MAYSPGEQPPGTNSNANSHRKTPSHPQPSARDANVHVAPSPPVLLVAVPGVSGGSVGAGKGSGSILLNFDNEEPARSNGAGQQPQRQPPQQPGGWDS